MIRTVEWNLNSKSTHIESIIHSSELVNGTSHLITNDKEERLFYENLELFFIYLRDKGILSETFKEYLIKIK
jgi:hypothetical protein